MALFRKRHEGRDQEEGRSAARRWRRRDRTQKEVSGAPARQQGQGSVEKGTLSTRGVLPAGWCEYLRTGRKTDPYVTQPTPRNRHERRIKQASARSRFARKQIFHRGRWRALTSVATDRYAEPFAVCPIKETENDV